MFWSAPRSLCRSFDSFNTYVGVGDSITAGNHTGDVSYVNDIWPDSINKGIPSATVATLNANAAVVDALLPLAPKQGILSVMIGINNFAVGDSVPTFLTAAASYLDARRAAGWKVVLIPILPDLGDAGANVWRNTANTTLETWTGVHADAVVDVSTYGSMWNDNAPLNATNYLSDKIHPTLVGQSIIAQAVGPVVGSFAK